MNAVDTNVFVYAFDDDEPVKQSAAVDLIHQLSQTPAETVLLWQVAAELLACLRRWQSAGKVSATDVEAHAHNVLAMFSLILPTPNVIERSINLTTRYSLSHWDSMLIAACIESEIDCLYSEDMGAGASYDSVTIVNPFR
jgi:predicted nucleic acid-binding protein